MLITPSRSDSHLHLITLNDLVRSTCSCSAQLHSVVQLHFAGIACYKNNIHCGLVRFQNHHLCCSLMIPKQNLVCCSNMMFPLDDGIRTSCSSLLASHQGTDTCFLYAMAAFISFGTYLSIYLSSFVVALRPTL